MQTLRNIRIPCRSFLRTEQLSRERIEHKIDDETYNDAGVEFCYDDDHFMLQHMKAKITVVPT